MIDQKNQTMTKFLIIIFIFISSFFLNSCGTMKDGFQNPKKDNSDEFLVEKKSPLIMPPEFDKLPTPNRNKKDSKSKENNLKKLITENQEIFDDKISNKKFEDSLLEKIKSN